MRGALGVQAAAPRDSERQPFHFRIPEGRAPGRFWAGSVFPRMFPFPPAVNRADNSGLSAGPALPVCLIPFVLASPGTVLG